MKVAFVLGACLLSVATALPQTPLRPMKPTPPIDGYVSPFANITAPTCTTSDRVTGPPRIQNGIINPYYRWQNFNVRPADDYNDAEWQAINDALYNLMQAVPCVTFGIWGRGSNPTGDYVYIIKGSNNGCNSYVGRQGGRQEANLQSPGCMSVGTIMHEMIHALGFHHTQCRPDRDNHVNIHWGNIQSGTEHNFELLNGNDWGTFNTPYNTRSIMHYNTYDFSSNGGPTVTGKNGEDVGSRGALEGTDIQMLRNMYGC